MTKTALRKKNFSKAKNLLIDEYKAYSVHNEGYFFSMLIDYEGHTLSGELTRECDFASHDSIRLGGEGWTEQERSKQRSAVKLEEEIHTQLKEMLTKVVDSPESVIAGVDFSGSLGLLNSL